MSNIEQFLSDPRTEYLARACQQCQRELDELEKMDDDGMGEMVQEEQQKLRDQIEMYMGQMRDITSNDTVAAVSPKEIVLEVRAGAGGDEASMFARDLASMYERYAATRGWSFTTNAISMNEVGGYKEGSFNVTGKGVYEALRYETGVHRVQRVPATEKSGRTHTSTASIAVLPIRKEANFELDQNDLRMEFSRSGGAGGQNVNKVESAVRLVHEPTGLEVRCTEERTQLKNREKAHAILAAKVAEHYRVLEEAKHAEARRSQIGTGDRSEKIRTYNILQDRLTDHRIKKSWSNVLGILAGDLQRVIDALEEASETEEASGVDI